MEVDGVFDGHSHDGTAGTERTITGLELWSGAGGKESSKIEA